MTKTLTARFSPLAARGRLRRLAHLVLLSLLLTTATGCGLRIDTGPPKLPEIPLAEAARNAAANSESQIVAGVEALPPGQAGPTLTSVAKRSQARLTALGGVWQPWPQGVPEGAETSPPPAAPPASRQEVLAALARGAAQARVDANALPDDPAHARLLAVLAAERSWDAQVLAKAMGTAVPAVSVKPSWFETPGANPPSPSTTPTESPTTATPAGAKPTETPEPVLSGGAAAQAGKALAQVDQARWSMEMVGARAPRGFRTSLGTRVEELDRFAQSLLTAGAEDTRSLAYQPAVSGDTAQALAALEQPVLNAQLGLFEIIPAEKRGDLVMSVEQTIRQLHGYYVPLGVLPGLNDKGTLDQEAS